MDLRGFEFYADTGLPVIGAAVAVYEAVVGTPVTVLADTVTDVNGMWAFTGLTDTPKDVKVTFIGEVRWYKGLTRHVVDKLHVHTALHVEGTLGVDGTTTLAGLLNVAGLATLTGGVKIPTGAGADKILTSDADGDGTWQTHAAHAPAYPLLAPDGSAAAPSYAFTNDTGLGMYRAADNVLGFSSSGIKRLTVDSAGLNLGNAGASQTVTTPGDELVLEETGDLYGAVRLRLQNRNGQNGAIFENAGLDLVDFAFKAGPAGVQRTIRFEGRAAFTYFGSGTEFQIGDPTAVTLLASDLGVAVLRGEFRTTVNVGIGATPGTAPRLRVVAPLANTYGIDIDHTWNNGALGYRGLRIGVTDTASLTTSLLIEALVGGAEKFAVDKSGFVRIGGATVAVKKPLVGSVAYNPPSLANGATSVTTVPVTGAAVGDQVIDVNHAAVAAAGTKWILYGYVSAANTVTVVFRNDTGGTVDLADGTLKATVLPIG